MCEFHSCLGIALGDNYEIRHDAGNSHSSMAGKIENKPNRAPVIFEVEASASTLIKCSDVDSIKSSIIRNFGKCPEPLVRKIVAHYQKVKQALTDGKHLSSEGYFRDTQKYADVWNEAQSLGICPDFSGFVEIHCSVDVREDATFTAPKLTKSGSVDVQQGATFTAPELKEVYGSVDVQQGATFTAPELKEVSGYVYVQQGATFTAPKLTKSGSVYVQQGATFTAPKLNKK